MQLEKQRSGEKVGKSIVLSMFTGAFISGLMIVFFSVSLPSTSSVVITQNGCGSESICEKGLTTDPGCDGRSTEILDKAVYKEGVAAMQPIDAVLSDDKPLNANHEEKVIHDVPRCRPSIDDMGDCLEETPNTHKSSNGDLIENLTRAINILGGDHK